MNSADPNCKACSGTGVRYCLGVGYGEVAGNVTCYCRNVRNEILQEMIDVATGRGYYETFLPIPNAVRHLSWTELHVDLKQSDPAAYKAAKYRWVSA